MKNWIIALAVVAIPLAAYYILDKNSENINALEARAAGKPAVIKFSSPMCLDCKKLDIVVKEVLPKYEDKIDYQNINAQSNDPATSDLIAKYKINLVPTMIFLKKNGSLHKKTEGTMSKNELEKYIKEIINE